MIFAQRRCGKCRRPTVRSTDWPACEGLAAAGRASTGSRLRVRRDCVRRAGECGGVSTHGCPNKSWRAAWSPRAAVQMNWCSAEYNLLTSVVIVNLVPALLASAVVYADDPPLVKLMGRKYSSDEAGDGPEVRVARRARADTQINRPTDRHADTHTHTRTHTHTLSLSHSHTHSLDHIASKSGNSENDTEVWIQTTTRKNSTVLTTADNDITRRSA